LFVVGKKDLLRKEKRKEKRRGKKREKPGKIKEKRISL